MKNKYDLIVFDLDGTLIDTLKDLNSAVNFALSKNGYPTKDLEHTRRSIGNGVAMLIRRSVPDGIDERSYQRVLSDFENHYRFHSSDMTTAYNGMKQVLEYLKEKKYLLAVSTNKIEDVAMSLINHLKNTIKKIMRTWITIIIMRITLSVAIRIPSLNSLPRTVSIVPSIEVSLLSTPSSFSRCP